MFRVGCPESVADLVQPLRVAPARALMDYEAGPELSYGQKQTWMLPLGVLNTIRMRIWICG